MTTESSIRTNLGLATTGFVERKTMRQLCDIIFNQYRDAKLMYIVIDPSFPCSQSKDQFYFVVQVTHIKIVHNGFSPKNPNQSVTMINYKQLVRLFNASHIELKLSRKSMLAKSFSQLNAAQVIIVDNVLVGDKGKEFYSHALAPIRPGNDLYSEEVRQYYSTLTTEREEVVKENYNMFDLIFGSKEQPECDPSLFTSKV